MQQIKSRDCMSRMRFLQTARLFLAVLLFSLFAAGTCLAAAQQQEVKVQPAKTAVAGSIDLSLTYGYQNIAKSGRFLPLEIVVSNGSGADISGELSIEIPEADGLTVRYTYPVNAPDGRDTKVRGMVSIAERNNTLRLVLRDEAGNVLAEREAPVSIQGDGSEVLLGILSNRPEDLAYFRGVSIGGTALKTRTVTLSPGDIPETEEGLEQLDIIIISDFNMYRLTDEVIEAICGWVEKGGVLLLGTGRNGDQLGGFQKHLEGVQLGSLEQANVDMGLKYSTDGPDSAVLSLPVRRISAEGATEAMQSADLPVLTRLDYGSGAVGITAYNLCDIRDFCMQQMGYTDELLQALMGSARLARVSAMETEENGSYETVRQLVSGEEPGRVPSMTVYFLLGAAYILFAGPGMYLYLRAKQLSSLYQPAVVLLAFLAALGLWAFNSGLRFEGPYIRYACVREIGEASASETEFVSLASPEQRSIELPVPDAYLIQPVLSAGKTDPQKTPSLFQEGGTGSQNAAIEILHHADGKTLRTSGMKPFAETYFELYRRTDGEEQPNELQQPLELDLQYLDERVSGSIVNTSETALENVTLLLYGRIVSVGNIGAGETKELSEIPVIYGPTGSAKLTADYVAGSSYYRQESREANEALARTALLSWYLEEKLNGSLTGAKLLAFMGEGSSLPSMEESGIALGGTTLLSVTAPVQFAESETHTHAALLSPPKVISGAYDAADNTTDEGAAVVLEYSLGNGYTITKLRFNSLSSVFSGKEDNGRVLSAFRGAMAFYNYQTSSYDIIDAGKTDFSGEELSPYLSPASTLTVRYIPDENAAEDTEMFLPVPTVTGETLQDAENGEAETADDTANLQETADTNEGTET